MKYLIKGGRILDPAQKLDKKADLLIESGKIVKIGSGLKTNKATVIDAKGKWVVPGIIDMHVHLREPGREDEETIASGTRTAALGGVTSVVCMPNTVPPTDSTTGLEFILGRVRSAGVVNVYPTGSITLGMKGEEITEIGDLYKTGAIAISEDGKSVMNSEIMQCALKYASMFNMPILSHCEDCNLSEGGSMHHGAVSNITGLKGIPSVAESIIVARDIALAEYTGGKLHICHASSKDTVELVRAAKKRRVKVSAEATPHHLSLTDELVKGFDANTKMKPPLMSKDHIDALWKGLKDGTIDVIASDHAPHTDIEKDFPFVDAPFGVIGLQTMIPVILTEWNKRKKPFSELELFAKMTVNPARVLGIDKGTLEIGKDADVTVIDPEKSWTVTVESLKSISKNSPFIGMTLTGMPVLTMVGGTIIAADGKLRK